MVTWCIDEIRYNAQEFKETGMVTVYDGDVVKSDNAIPPSVQQALKAAAAHLEDIPEMNRDWHPGSDGTVLDLVHPSLFPVVYGQTRILKDDLVGLDDCVDRCGEGVTLEVPPSEQSSLLRHVMTNPYSRKFQWLPCEVVFDGDHVK
jgi:hypothetical protein